MLTTVRALLDLVLPTACAGCAAEGELWCPVCARSLAGPARPASPDPRPAGLPPAWATASYTGPVRAAVVAHKERGARALGRPLGAALADALAGAAAAVPDGRPLLVVPAPSRPAAVRARGDDPTRRLAVLAVAGLRATGHDVAVLAALRMGRSTADQAGLGMHARADNLAGAIRVPRRLEPAVRSRAVVVVDDVMTTGATLVEAARALNAAGADVVAAAVVAATPRRGVAPTGLSLPTGRD